MNSLDCSVSGFWFLVWDTLDIASAPNMYHHFVDWPDRAVRQFAVLLRRQGKGLPRPYMSIEVRVVRVRSLAGLDFVDEAQSLMNSNF